MLKRTWAGEVRNVSLLVAMAVNTEGYREILGIVEGAKEDRAGWPAFLKHLGKGFADHAAGHFRVSSTARAAMASCGRGLPRLLRAPSTSSHGR